MQIASLPDDYINDIRVILFRNINELHKLLATPLDILWSKGSKDICRYDDIAGYYQAYETSGYIALRSLGDPEESLHRGIQEHLEKKKKDAVIHCNLWIEEYKCEAIRLKQLKDAFLQGGLSKRDKVARLAKIYASRKLLNYYASAIKDAKDARYTASSEYDRFYYNTYVKPKK